jgi:hypothetical protein
MIMHKELQARIDLMDMMGISEAHKDYLIESANDVENDDIISLVDDLSSKAWWLCAAQGSDEMRARGEAHLESRRKLIEKIKELRG